MTLPVQGQQNGEGSKIANRSINSDQTICIIHALIYNKGTHSNPEVGTYAFILMKIYSIVTYRSPLPPSCPISWCRGRPILRVMLACHWNTLVLKEKGETKIAELGGG